ncbi:MAG: hypothetical protein HY809_07395 [Nitrospirae bacterium]|nr:hypothetical protein [Nitrospirota bacterium]
MKRVLLIALLFFSASPCRAEVLDVFQFSGNEWVKWDSSLKYGFIGGFIAGGAYVAINSQTELIDRPAGDKEPSSGIQDDSSKKDIISSMIMYLKDDKENDLTRYFIKGVPSNKIVKGLDELYVNPHHRGIKVVDAVYLVRKQIDGASSEEIAATIEYLISGKDISKLHFKDKSGAFRAVRFP